MPRTLKKHAIRVCGGPAAVFGFLLSIPALQAQRPLHDDEILKYLSQTIAWHQSVTSAVQSATEAGETISADAVRQTSARTVQLAFQFARAQAAIPSTRAAESASGEGGRADRLAQLAAAAAQRAEQAQLQIEQINRQLQNASARSRPRLLALRDEITSEANFAKARRDALQALLGFLTGSDEGGLAAKISVLERSVPEAAAPPADSGSNVRSPESQNFHLESSGIVGLTTELFSISRRMSRLDGLTRQTEALRNACDKIRQPLRDNLRQVIRRGDEVAQAPESSDVAGLNGQRKEMEALLARLRQILTSSTPLNEQFAHINASRSKILEWRSSLGERYGFASRHLLLRLGMLAVELLVIWALSKLWHRSSVRYVQDLRRRRQLLLLRRVVVVFLFVLVIVLSFVTEFGSLATFAGFSAAGIAVAMQSVILSIVAYFFLIGRWGVRVGDRVTVSGITGEVADVGLFRLYLMELGGRRFALQPTGRVVVFPNSIFFQPAAVFKQVPGIDYVWRSITLNASGTTDYSAIESHLLAAVKSIYAEYRDVLERQHRDLQSSLNLHAAVPEPESHVRLIDSGVEITITYPVEIRRVNEIDDRVTREVMRRLEDYPNLVITSNGGSKAEAEVR